MTDLSETLQAESDQQNAVDYMSGPRTIQITKVGGPGGKARQPIWIYFHGDDGRPWKPCKTMRRLLVAHWGPNGDDYVGRLVTIYRDPRVDFGEDKGCGGIRISHLSHPKSEDPIVLPTGKNKRAAFRVQRLDAPEPKPQREQKPKGDITQALAMLEQADKQTIDGLVEGLKTKAFTRDEWAQMKPIVERVKAGKATAIEVQEAE